MRNRHFFAFDVLAALAAPALSVLLITARPAWLREHAAALAQVTLAFLLVEVAAFYLAGLYRRFWRYAGVDEMVRIFFGVGGAVSAQALLFFAALRPAGIVPADLPGSLLLVNGMLLLIATGSARYSVRLAQRLQQRRQAGAGGKRVLVVGAGEAGIGIVEEMRSRPALGLYPVAFIDDAPEKQAKCIRALDVVGGRADIPDVVRKMNPGLIVIAISAASGTALRDIALICRETGVETKILPGVYEMLYEQAGVGQLRDVQVEDLLRRPAVKADTDRLAGLVRGRRILVTGAGGSIGAELCRQMLYLKPAALVLLGHGENSIFSIEAELRMRRSTAGDDADVCIHAVIADIRDTPRMEQVFGRFRPEMVFHAAAHKHVPLMERNVEEAVTNNILGTRNVLACCEASGVDRFILISTDKAVAPASMLGATKQVAERLVGETALRTGRAYATVRFGNVLGSRGSMLHVFRRQLMQRQPLTVTHPEVRRYFMTTAEAVHLVLEAAALGHGGEVFVLDMGAPLRILDLARDLIRLSGMQEGRDVDIVFTGLRPGEKMSEQLFGEDEHVERTAHEKIMVCRRRGREDAGREQGREAQGEHLAQSVDLIVEAAHRGDTDRVVRLMEVLVPTYRPGDLVRAQGDAGPERQAAPLSASWLIP